MKKIILILVLLISLDANADRATENFAIKNYKEYEKSIKSLKHLLKKFKYKDQIEKKLIEFVQTESELLYSDSESNQGANGCRIIYQKYIIDVFIESIQELINLQEGDFCKIN